MTQTIRRNNLTSGHLFSKILLFVLPIVATNVLQTFYNAADMMVVGLSDEANAVGAIGITSAFVSLILNLFIGFSVGINVIVAQNIGAENNQKVSDAVHTGTVVSFLFGLFGGLAGFIAARWVLSIMGNTGSLLELATLYTRIYFVGTPFLALTNCLVAIFRAKGDSRTPLIVLTLAGIVNLLLNLFFVLVFNMSVEGVAIATVLSNVFSTVVLAILLSKQKDSCRLFLKKLKIKKDILRDTLRVGLPASIQGVLFSLSNMLIQSSIITVNNLTVPSGSEYEPVVKGNVAAANLEGFAYSATNSVYQASVTFVGQNYGAKRLDRVWKTLGCCYAITCIIAVVFGYGLFFGRNFFLSLYGVVNGAEGSLESIAYDAAVVRMEIMFTTYCLLACMEVGSGVLRGLGRSVISTTVSLVGACGLRILWIETVFNLSQTLQIIYWSYPISWGLTALTHLTCIVVVMRKEKKKLLSQQKTA